MTSTTISGQSAWQIKFTPSRELSSNTGLIFNNSHSGNGNQTADLILVNGGIYNRQGLVSGVTTIQPDENEVSISGQHGSLTITCSKDTNITITRIDGTQFTINATAGSNTYYLPHGFYIVNGKKFAL
jgi:hypothetical protein